jgi:hypothetical protein
VLGQRLRLHLPDGTRQVAIDYQTSPDAVALQWLTPAQTAVPGDPRQDDGPAAGQPAGAGHLPGRGDGAGGSVGRHVGRPGRDAARSGPRHAHLPVRDAAGDPDLPAGARRRRTGVARPEPEGAGLGRAGHRGERGVGVRRDRGDDRQGGGDVR